MFTKCPQEGFFIVILPLTSPQENPLHGQSPTLPLGSLGPSLCLHDLQPSTVTQPIGMTVENEVVPEFKGGALSAKTQAGRQGVTGSQLV